MKIKTCEQLCESLLENFEKVLSGEINPAVVQAAANTAGKVYSHFKNKIEYHKSRGSIPSIPFYDE